MLLLLITLLFLLTLQGVSAIDNGNLTQELQLGDNDNSFSALQSLIDGGNATINLDKDYVQYDGEKTIKISRNVTINGNGHSIDANDNIRALLISADNVVLNNITFKNGNDKLGGAIDWQGANGILANSSFINNKATGTDTATNYEGGGAVYWSGNNGLIANSTFESNSAGGHGGAIWWSGNDGIIENSVFERNTASKWGGAVYSKGTNVNIRNVNFTGNKGSNGGSLAIVGEGSTIDNLIFDLSNGTLGGALYWNVKNGVIKNSKFYNSHASGSNGGGAVYTTSSATLTTIEHCDFINNTAAVNGGAIYAYSKAIVNDCHFYNNNASNFGGAIYFNAESSEVNSSEFNNNNALKSGGAVYITNRFSIINNSVFKNNTAEYAGAVYFSSYKHKLNNTLFEGNNATVDGGAVYLGSYGTIVDNATFIGNSAVRGGALYNYVGGTTATTKTEIINSEFKYNNATAGGAMASFAKFIGINNTDFTFNKASYGSAIYMDRTSYTISNSTFLNNSADSVKLTLNLDESDYTATAVYTVNNTLLNAIYRIEGSVLLENVIYWGENGISNSDDGYIEDIYAINQNITLIVKDNTTSVIYNVTNQTRNGNVIFKDLLFKPGSYTLQAIHYEDNYYTEIESNIETLNIDGVFSKLELVNDTIFYGENALVITSYNATGNVSIFIGKYYTAEIDHGLANISLEGLACGTYGALISYTGDDYYDASGFATQIKIIENVPGAYSYLKTEYANTVQAGINNTLTLTVENIGIKSGKNVKIRVLSENIEIAVFDVEDYEAGQYYKFSFIDPILRPLDESSVFNVTHKLANYTIIVEDENGQINSTNFTFPIIYNGYLGKDYAYPQEFNDKITRIYKITGDVIIVNSPYTKYASSTDTYRVENFTVDYRNDVAEALLYVPYNWDSVETGDYNRWHAVFNNGFITPIAHYRDQANLGGYGNRGYGLVVYNVTEFVKSGNNVFELTKVRSGCAVYPSSLMILTNNSLSSTIKKVYITENADLLSKQYSLNSTVGELTKMDNINNASVLKSDLYVFAASAEIDEGNIIFNGNNINNVWRGNSSSLEMFKLDITNDIEKNNLLFFEATGATILALHQIIVVESDEDKKDLTLNVTRFDMGGNITLIISGFENATGNVTVTIGENTTTTSIMMGMAFVSVPKLNETVTAHIYYPGDDNYNSASATVEIKAKKDLNLTVSADPIGAGENATVIITGFKNATGNVTVIAGRGFYNATIIDGTATVNIPGLNNTTTAYILYRGDENYNMAYTSVNITVKDVPEVVIDAPDVVKYYHGPERFVVTITDGDGNPLVNKSVDIVVNGVKYTRNTDENGIASIGIGLNSGVYNVTTEVDNITVNSVVTVLSTVEGNDLVKVFRNATPYTAVFKDSEGNYLAKGTLVEYNINGVMYRKEVGENGVAKLNINLPQGTYIITATNTVTGENCANNITVLPRIVENKDITKFYKNDTQYTVKLIGDDGNPVGAGEVVTFNINGVFYNRTTNASGEAKLNINLPPGDYVITADYKGCKVSNNIKVLPVLSAKDITMKYHDGTQFVATLVDGQGKPYPDQTVTFNINGVFYNKQTDSEGKAKLNINLMPGEYIITSSYNGVNIANKITIHQ